MESQKAEGNISKSFKTRFNAHRWLKPRLEPEQQLALAEEVQAVGLSVMETQARKADAGQGTEVASGPMRLSLEVYEALQRIAPDGDVKRLIQETVEKLIQT